MSLVSIIVPSYNSAHLIKTTLDSIKKSTYQDYEVIIIDDGSTDNTKETVSSFLDDNRFKYFFQNNKGLAGARNTGIEQTKGEFLVFLDSDDVIEPDKLYLQVNYLQSHSNIDLVYSKSLWFIEDDLENTFPVTFPIHTGDVYNHLIFGNFIHVNSVMCRKEAITKAGNFDESFKELEDWDLWLRMSINGAHFACISKVLSRVRVRKGSMTSNQLKMNKTMVRVLKKMIPIIKRSHNENDIIKAYHALFIYRLKAKEKQNFLIDLVNCSRKLGVKFFPIMCKLYFKRLISPFLNDNKTTKELKKLWAS